MECPDCGCRCRNPSKRDRLAHLRKQQAEYKKSVENFRAKRAKEHELVYERLRIYKAKQEALWTQQSIKKVYSREYSSYRSMISRCNNPKNSQYKYYGGKGIKIWKKWLGPNGFDEFLHVMGERPAGTSLERVNIKKNYYPNNCIWADAYLQASNKSNNVRIKFGGETKTLMQWSQKMGIEDSTIVSRIQAGWSVRQAFGLEIPPTGRISAPVEITYRKQTKTLKEWSKKVNIPRYKLFDRYERGWEPGEILGYKKRKIERGTKGKPLGLTYKGKTQSVYDWAKERNMDPQVILNRVAKKWEIAAVLGYIKADTRTEEAKEEGRKMKLRKVNKCATRGCPNQKKHKKKGPGGSPKYCRVCRP